MLVVCGDTVDEAMKNDIAIAERLRITATTLTACSPSRARDGRKEEISMGKTIGELMEEMRIKAGAQNYKGP